MPLDRKTPPGACASIGWGRDRFEVLMVGPETGRTAGPRSYSVDFVGPDGRLFACIGEC